MKMPDKYDLVLCGLLFAYHGCKAGGEDDLAKWCANELQARIITKFGYERAMRK